MDTNDKLWERYELEKELDVSICPRCGENDTVITGRQTFAGSREEPAEYMYECESCGYETDDWEGGYPSFEDWMEDNYTDQTSITEYPAPVSLPIEGIKLREEAGSLKEHRGKHRTHNKKYRR